MRAISRASRERTECRAHQNALVNCVRHGTQNTQHDHCSKRLKGEPISLVHSEKNGESQTLFSLFILILVI